MLPHKLVKKRERSGLDVLLRECAHPGCGVLVRKGRCAAHADALAKAIDAQRESRSRRGYTRRWYRYRAAWFREHPLCGDRLDGPSAEHSRCVAAGVVTPMAELDHIVPHDGDARRFWDPSNHQSLCKLCHSAKTMRESNAKKVYG